MLLDSSLSLGAQISTVAKSDFPLSKVVHHLHSSLKLPNLATVTHALVSSILISITYSFLKFWVLPIQIGDKKLKEL